MRKRFRLIGEIAELVDADDVRAQAKLEEDFGSRWGKGRNFHGPPKCSLIIYLSVEEHCEIVTTL